MLLFRSSKWQANQERDLLNQHFQNVNIFRTHCFLNVRLNTTHTHTYTHTHVKHVLSHCETLISLHFPSLKYRTSPSALSKYTYLDTPDETHTNTTTSDSICSPQISALLFLLVISFSTFVVLLCTQAFVWHIVTEHPFIGVLKMTCFCKELLLDYLC